MTKEDFIQLCDEEGYEIPEEYLNKDIWTEKPPLRRKSDIEELAKSWIEAEEAKKTFYKLMDDILVAQKVYIAKLECYNAKKIKQFRKEKQRLCQK